MGYRPVGADECIKDRISPNDGFELENDLLEAFRTHLKAKRSPFREFIIAKEFDFSTGRTDVLGVNAASTVVAFEAKLDRWRIAVHQAYRNATFADYSYVVLPERAAATALASQFEFGRRNVGLIAVSRSKMEILLLPEERPVLRPQLREKALEYVRNANSRDSAPT